MGIFLCIHKAAEEIGGNCIEIKASSGERILLDAGRPLDTPDGEQTPIPASLDIDAPVSGVLLSHAHADHCGLLERLPAAWTVFCGRATERLLRIYSTMNGKPVSQICRNWSHGKPIVIGPFTVTPHLIDHSAFDAYALQIVVEGKTIVYSGDFRAHGRKAKLTKALMANPPAQVDILLLEGTNLRAADAPAKLTLDETALEEGFARLFRESAGRVFVSWSATNIDRVVTLFRACKKSGRTLVVDLYSMFVLMQLKEFANIPQPDWPGGHILAVVTAKMIRLMKRLSEPKFVEQLKQYRAAMSAQELASTPEKWVIMARSSLVDDYRVKGVVPTETDTWAWSLWNGYLERDSTLAMRDFFTPCQKIYIHSSGHASPEILRQFAEAMRPEILIPVHGENWKYHTGEFDRLHILSNGEWFELGGTH